MRHEDTGLSPAERRRRRRRTLFFVCFGVLVPVGACGTNAVGVDQCDQIETARCNRAVMLDCGGGDTGINLSIPPHPEDNLSACIRFYGIACLHGLAIPALPAATSAVPDCVSFITNDASCAFVGAPQSASECAWLDAGPDAEAAADVEAEASDAGTDADVADVKSDG